VAPHGNQKRRWSILTEGRGPWELESAKHCVTTDPPNRLALKMDEAGRGFFAKTKELRPFTAHRHFTESEYVRCCKEAWKLVEEEDCVSNFGKASSADLGFSSKYTSRVKFIMQNLVDRRGKWFPMKLEAIGVSRELRGDRKTVVKNENANFLRPRKRILLKIKNRKISWFRNGDAKKNQ